MTDRPTDSEDRAFWALLILSQIWAAAGSWFFLVWALMALYVRGAYWLLLLKGPKK